MRTLSIVVIALIFEALTTLAQSPTPSGDQEKAGLRILDAIIEERDEEVWSMTHPELRKKAAPDWLTKFGTQLRKMKAAGGFNSELVQLAMRWKRDPMGQPAGFDRV